MIKAMIVVLVLFEAGMLWLAGGAILAAFAELRRTVKFMRGTP